MFKTMTIPRKLGFSFMLISAAAAVVMIVFYSNIMMISSSTARNNYSQSIYAKALTLETSILRQNSQFRGFLVTGDETYLKSYKEAREEYDKTSAELEKMLTDPAKIELVLTSRRETLAWRMNWGDKLIGWVREGHRDAAQDAVRHAGAAVLVSKAALPLRDIRDPETKAIEQNSGLQNTAIKTALITLFLGGIALIGLAITLAMALSRIIARPITGLTRTMAELAAGNDEIAVPATGRNDELGAMARAVLVFRDASVTKRADDRDRDQAMTDIGKVLHQLSEADLTPRLHGLPPTFHRVAEDFNAAASGLSDAMASVRGSVESIKTNSDEISRATDDLSTRSERQAASLQESASALDEITRVVREGATNATEANRAMSDARQEAELGGAIVRKAVEAMNGIDQASKEIVEIISVIDGIAFQTNLLALNAGVEAARAGDSGKGFAVVASEVRALAQRSAEAATGVKKRISAASDHIRTGVGLVSDTGSALERIIERVASVSVTIGTIARSSDQQASGLGQVNTAISDMREITQQNAAMVEETTAAARHLVQEAEQLAGAVAIFAVSESSHEPQRRNDPPRAAARRAPRALRTSGNLAVVAQTDW